MKYCFVFLLSLCATTIFSQTCNLDFEDFTGATNTNPPSGWIKGSGTNIGTSFPADPVNDPAVGFNNVGENMISESFNCASQICFDWHSSSVNSVHQVEISYTQDDPQGAPIWIPIDTISTPGSGNTPNTYTNVCYELPDSMLLAPFGISIKWEMIQRTSGTFYLENVCTDIGECAVIPTKLEFTEIPNGCKPINTLIGMTICAVDDNGYIDSSYTDNITVSQASGGGTSSGTFSGKAIDGCFDALIEMDAEGLYTYTASSTDNALLGSSPSINVQITCPNTDTLRVMSYNLLNYPDGRDDCGPNTVVPNRWDTLANINEYVQPDVLMVCELQNEAGSDSILSKSLNINGISYYAAANFVPNQSTASTQFNNMFYYNSDKMTLFSQDEILTTTRDFNKYTVYMNDPQLAIHQDTVFIDFYMAHLKAGSSTEDIERRANDCQTLRDYLDSRPERNNILGGDLNFYSDTEDGYQNLITGTHPFDDPTDMEGNWDGNATFAEVCTQSSRGPGDDSYDCGFGGGIDSRFDFLLSSLSIKDSTDHVSIIPDSYTPVGNDGSTYNKAINDPSNTSGVPMDILTSMYFMSDHIPVIMDLQVTYPLDVDSCLLVYSTANDGPGSLREAIACAEPESTILFSPDLNGQTIILNIDSIQIYKNITIAATPLQNISISSTDPQISSIKTIFHILPSVTVSLNGFTIIGAFGPDGSAIINEGDLLLDNMNITNGEKMDINSVVENKLGGILRVRDNTQIE